MAPAKTSKDMESNNGIEVKDFAYCSDKYQYTMGKSFYETGRKDVIAVSICSTEKPRRTTTGRS